MPRLGADMPSLAMIVTVQNMTVIGLWSTLRQRLVIAGNDQTSFVLAALQLDAATRADIVVLTVPFAHQVSTLEVVRPGLTGKILVDVTVPLTPPKVGTVQMPGRGSAAEMAQDAVGEEVQVVSAFQNVGAQHLREDHAIACDVLVTGNKRAARDKVIELVEATGLKGWHAGPLANAAAAEALTSVLITINRHHKIEGSGITITGEPAAGD